jgi:hypothetical protein
VRLLTGKLLGLNSNSAATADSACKACGKTFNVCLALLILPQGGNKEAHQRNFSRNASVRQKSVVGKTAVFFAFDEAGTFKHSNVL